MRPIVSIVGKSKSGKTTLLEGLITGLKQRGYKIAVIKHAANDFELDKTSKDSWRFSQATDGAVAISSPRKFAVIKKVEHDLSPQELSRFIGEDYDIILTEGFKQSNTPKVEVHRKEQGKELLCSPKQLLAIITDEPLDVDVPQFSPDEIPKLTDLIENWLSTQLGQDDVELFINESFIPINLFIKELLARIMVAMVSTLKGVKEVKSLHISFKKKT